MPVWVSRCRGAISSVAKLYNVFEIFEIKGYRVVQSIV